MKLGPVAKFFRTRRKSAREPAPAPHDSASFRSALLQAMTEASADGILVVSPEGQILSVNSQMVEQWSLPPEIVQAGSDELALASVVERVADSEAFLAKIRHLYANPDERSWDEITLKTGRILERYSAPVVGVDGTRYGRIWFFRDVTARKEAEELLEKLRKEFAASIVHDLRAPIQTILLQTNLFLRSAVDGKVEVQEAALRRIEKQTLQLARMTTDLLDTTAVDLRRLRLELEAFALTELASDTIEDFKPLLMRHLIELKSDAQTPPVRADRHRIAQVLVNLLTNAASYSPDGTAIEVSVKPSDGGVELSVHDQGAGIPETELPHVFDRFFRSEHTRSKVPGHGLGLYVARAFVEAHGGHIIAESAPNEGSTFRFWLPAATPAPAPH
ncbi:MAG: PAS-domain containing protein [Deltaproteobacteria bacterium]|nr:PAS-domain containing protein [Deltaproteobacteria bacterium]